MVTAMGDDRLTVRQRVQAVEGIERYVAELSGIASWLAEHGADAACILAEDAVRNLCAAGWLLERPIGARCWDCGLGRGRGDRREPACRRCGRVRG